MPKLPDGVKYTDIIYARIDSIIQEMLKNDRYLQAKRNGELTRKVMEQFGISQRTAEGDIAEAKKEIKKMMRAKKDEAFKRAIRDREFVVSAAKIGDDLKLALEAMKDRDKLYGLYVDEVKQSGELTMKNVDMSKFTEYGLERLKRGDVIEEVLMDPKAVKSE